MKNLKRLTFVIVLVALLLGMATVVNAESVVVVSEEETSDSREVVFANGTEITITAREDGAAGATIKYEGGSVNVDDDAIIFGGSHSDSIANISETNITMEGGKVGIIFGGNLHVGTVGTANVVINGGTVNFVMGGGAALMSAITCTNHSSSALATAAADAKTVVNQANVTVNGGTVGYVYGGGENKAYTKSACVSINDGKVTFASGSGSNGFMDDAEIYVTGGEVTTLVTVNRGTLETATVLASGGTITGLYVTGTDATGSVKEVTIDLDGDVKVGTLSDGQNYSDLDTDEDGNKAFSISMIASAVTTNSLSQLKGKGYEEVKKITITVAGKEYEVNKGTTVEALKEANADVITAMKTYIALTGEDLEYVLADDEGIAYGLEDPLDVDVTLKVAVKEPDAEDPGTTEPGDDQPGTDVPGTDEPGTTEPEPDNGNGGSTANPNTGDNVVVYSVAGLAGLSIVAISLVRKNKLSK